MEDSDLMPFGKYKGIEMINVPASYLIWLHNEASSGVRGAFPQVFEYIDDCMDALKQEVKK